MKKPSPFDISAHLSEKNELEFSFSDYSPWMINSILSNHLQTVLWANEMNFHYELSKEQQYQFLYSAIPKGKRFGKWPKKDQFDKEVLDLVQQRFQLNIKRATEVLRLLTPEQILWLKQAQGGHNG